MKAAEARLPTTKNPARVLATCERYKAIIAELERAEREQEVRVMQDFTAKTGCPIKPTPNAHASRRQADLKQAIRATKKAPRPVYATPWGYAYSDLSGTLTLSDPRPLYPAWCAAREANLLHRRAGGRIEYTGPVVIEKGEAPPPGAVEYT